MKDKIKKAFGGNSFRYGTYSVVLTAVVIAIIAVINVLVAGLPSAVTNVDMTSVKLYSIGETTEELVGALKEDVTIYVIATEGSENKTLMQMLDKYVDLSSHVKVELIDPNTNPVLLTKYNLNSDEVDLSGTNLLVVSDTYGGNTFAKVIRFDWDYATIHSTGSSNGPVQLAMSSSKDSYKVGENIIVSFPANEKSTALVTVEANDRVLQTYLLNHLGTEGQVEIKATEEMIPNVYVYVSLLQPRDGDTKLPLRMYGVVPVKVEDSQLQLKPVLVLPETSNTKKTIQVKVKEENAKAMTYTLAVVDEGILGLTNYSTPNPYDYFNAKQALKVRTWDNYDYIIDAFNGKMGTLYAVGGDGFINQEITLDKRFKAYAVTLEIGRAHV